MAQRDMTPCDRNYIMDTVLEGIGATPMVRLDRLARNHGLKCNLYGKAEYFSSGGSIKDRIAKRMVEEAEKDGRLIPGQSVVIEPTSGNTGVGLALVCAIKGYPLIITLPEKMSLEKEVALRALGAEIVRTPTEAPSQGEESNIGVAKRLQRTIPGGVILDQYSNPNNPLAHELTTGPEIIHAITTTPSTPERPSTEKVDLLVAGAGTGGTITGLSKVIKETHNSECVIVGVDPVGSLLAGPSKDKLGGYMVEGIGYDFVPDVLNYTHIDTWIKITDDETFPTARELIRTEGMLVGGSSGAAIAAALKYLKSEEGFEKFGNVEGKNVIIILPDSIRNYMSKDWFADAIKAQPPTELWGLIQESLEKTKPQKGHPSGSGVASNVATANGIAPAVNGGYRVNASSSSLSFSPGPKVKMLISDPDYLIHTLRLTYLRHVEDPFGARIITLNPQYSSNPYIRAAGLADKEAWPEINMPQSPQPTIEEFDSQSFGGFSDGGPSPVVPRHRQLSQPAEPAGVYPGATGLKYTQTIVPAKRGVGAGMRVSGRRSSAASRSGTPSMAAGSGSLATATEAIDSRLQRIRSDSAPTPVSSSTQNRSSPMIAVEDDDEGGTTTGAGSGNDGAKRRSSGGSTVMQSLAITKLKEPAEPERSASPQVAPAGASGQVNGTPAPAGAQTTTTTTPENGGDPNRPPLPPFALRFARQAEMEARRRERMKARFNGAAARAAAAAGGGSGAVTPMRDISPVRAPSVEPVRRQVSNQSSALIDDSSSEEEGQRGIEEAENSEPDSEAADGDESSEDEEEVDLEGAVEGEDDEFEGGLSVPYPMAPVVSTTTGSDDTSMLSSGISVSHSSAFGSSLHIVHSVRNRHRLSPVSENHHGEHKAGDKGRDPSAAVAEGEREAAAEAGGSPVSVRPHHVIRRQNRSYFSISPPERVNPRSVTSPQSAAPSSEPSRPEPLSIMDPASRQDSTATSASRGAATSPTVGTNPSSSPSVFTKMPVRRPPLKSALTAMLSAKNSVSDNPFTTLYAAMSGRAESASVTLRVWFPESGGPAAQKPLELKMRRDATVEEAIGFGLWSYWDQGIEPKLDEGLEGEGEEVEAKREVRLSALGWNLRIAEFDGEVDEDFPALDRSRPISKFNFNDYAICEATPTQVEQNRILESKIVRRPSRMMMSKKSRSDTNTSATTAATNLGPPTVGGGVTMTGGRTPSDTMLLSNLTGANPKSGLIMSNGPAIFLRVRIAAAADMHYSTTVNATSEEYMADVLERVCRRRKIENSKEWALVTGDMRIVIPLDRTVASLAGKSDLVLVKRALLDQLGIKDKRGVRSSDPNASIFKRMSEIPASSAALDFTAAYKRFVVYRKLPMLVGRHERALAIDGDYIHIMPAANRGLLDSVKTSSYHKRSIKYCKQSKRPPMTTVKLVVGRDGGNKTYDFEAEDAKKAAEIVACIKNLKSTTVERSGTVKQTGRNPRRTTKQYL